MTLTMRNKYFLLVAGFILFTLACQALFPAKITPGSLPEKIAAGNLRFGGSANITYIGCQDPTAVVNLYIAPPLKEMDGIEFDELVNPISISAITQGTQIKMETCQKTNLDGKYDWPAKGIYYPKDEKIIFTTCTQSNDRAEGQAFLVGEGFEGEYSCYDGDGGLIYEVALSAYEVLE